jgi:hypothetical protein
METYDGDLTAFEVPYDLRRRCREYVEQHEDDENNEKLDLARTISDLGCSAFTPEDDAAYDRFQDALDAGDEGAAQAAGEAFWGSYLGRLRKAREAVEKLARLA